MLKYIVKYTSLHEKYDVVDILDGDFAIITAEESDIIKDENITDYELPFALYPMSQDGKEASCIISGDENVGGLSGEGVIMGIIDSGITPNHREFEGRIIYIWDIPNDRVYDRDEIAGGIDYADTNGHGTAVAGIASGKSGIAYNSLIIAVAIGRGSSEDIMRGIKFIAEKANEMDMPFVINISYGTNYGPHNGQSLFEQYIDNVSEQNRTLIVVASGNEGDKAHHYSGRGSNTVEFSIGKSIKEVTLEMWKSFIYNAEIDIVSPDGDTMTVMSGRNGIYSQTLQNTYVTAETEIPTPQNAEERISIRLRGQSFADSGIWKLIITADSRAEYDMWLPVSEGVDENTIFLDPDSYTTLTIPSTAFRALTVGAYNAETLSVAPFSGRGSTRNVVFQKPDICAPGVNIKSASNTGGYDYFTGTSFAAPFASGTAALLMEWGIVKKNDTDMYSQKIKALMTKYAQRDGAGQYPGREWGYGRLCFRNIYNSPGGVSGMSMNNSFKALSQDYVDIMIEKSDEVLKTIDSMDISCCHMKYVNYVIVYVPVSTYELLITNSRIGSGIRSATPLILGIPDRNFTIPENLTAVRNLPAGYRGSGVLIGIADTGIDINDPAFKYENGESRIYSMWVQDEDTDEDNDNICFGREYTRAEITDGSIALKGDTAHGTAMAKAVLKTAPDAEFVIVKLKQAKNYYRAQIGIPDNTEAFESTDLMLGIEYILTKAKEAKRPASIAVGLGTNESGHGAQSILETYLSLFALNNGICITTAAGNEALSAKHTAFEINGGMGYKDVEISVGKGGESFTMWMWNDVADRADIAVIPPVGNEISRIEARNNFINTYELNLTNTSVRVEYRIPLYRTSSQETIVTIKNAIEGIWRIRVYGRTTLGTINCWLPLSAFGNDVKFLTPVTATTVVNPATALSVIAVGAYDTENNRIVPSSGRGPTRDGRLRPDFMAPSASSTAISAGITAGVSALLLEWGLVRGNNLNINTASIKSYMLRGALPPESGELTPNNTWGYGLINLYNIFDNL